LVDEEVEARPPVGVVLNFFQGCDTVGWVRGRASGMWRKLCHLQPKVLFWNECKEENRDGTG